MTQLKRVEADIVIIGGGIAGLWLLNRLRQQGYAAILLESGTLGGEQTHKAQGIIHGGLKYALQGALTSATTAIADMPALWSACLAGDGVLDLHAVPVLSKQQYLWTTGGVGSKVAGFFAGLALRGQVHALARAAYPDIFQHAKFRGEVYALDEQVLDVHALIRELVCSQQDAIFRINPLTAADLHFNAAGELDALDVNTCLTGTINICAKKYIFAAGRGNDILFAARHNLRLQSQRRPLHMVVVKHDFPYELYAHCLGLGATPRMTITTHHSLEGKTIWYIGGQLAEGGVSRSAAAQCAVARAELAEVFPWLDFSAAQFAAFKVDRVEAQQPGSKRPDSFSLIEEKNYFAAWPTKLALAPLLAEAILARLADSDSRSGKADLRELRHLPVPAFAQPVWEQVFGMKEEGVVLCK